MSRLKPEDVQFLTLEGGGGKGFAFLGAVQELERRGIVNVKSSNTPRGIAGSSAGAITAAFIASGMTSADIEKLMNEKDFDDFFDAPDLKHQQGALDKIEVPNVDSWWKNNDEAVIKLVAYLEVLKSLASVNVTEAIAKAIKDRKLSDLTRSLKALDKALKSHKKLLRNIAILLGAAPSAYDSVTKMTAIERLLDKPAFYGASLLISGGFYPGHSAWEWFDKKLAEQMAKATGKEPLNHRKATFKDFKDIFGRELAITGTNLSTTKSEVFSADTTPQLPVATAIRISMSLPVVFKPVVIDLKTHKRMAYFKGTGSMPKEKLVGSWVDGGLLNNIPLRVFQNAKRPDAAQHTLVLRLDVEDLRLPDATKDLTPQTQRQNTTGLMATLRALTGTMIGAGESHITESWDTAHQSIELPTIGLDTLVFSPPKAAAEASKKRSKAAIAAYFNSTEN